MSTRSYPETVMLEAADGAIIAVCDDCDAVIAELEPPLALSELMAESREHHDACPHR